MTLEEQGKILKFTNATLGKSSFSNEKINTSPNPTASILNLNFSNDVTIDKIMVIDMSGKTVLQQNQNFTQINVEKLAKGLYIIEVHSQNGKFSSKFVKE